MSWRNIHVDDYGWVGKLRIVQDGEPVDISTYTTRQFIFTKPDGTEVTKTATFDTDGTNGVLRYVVETGVMNVVSAKWSVRALLTKVGSELTSAPLNFSVKARGD